MIPTRLKAKLPRHLSYPVGAGSISEALAGVPHFEALSITFWNEAVWPASKFQRLLAERLPYKVMTALYMPTRKPGIIGSNHMVQSGWYDEKWELSVYPVLAEFRSRANRLLQEKGLPAIVAWLQSSNRAGWITTSQWIELIFNPTDESLTSHVGRGV